MLLGTIDEAPTGWEHDDTVIRQRLGIAASLFRALRAKHAPTANHCLRVALRCSFIANLLDVKGTELDYLVINNCVYEKTAQNDHENREKWRVKFKMD